MKNKENVMVFCLRKERAEAEQKGEKATRIMFTVANVVRCYRKTKQKSLLQG